MESNNERYYDLPLQPKVYNVGSSIRQKSKDMPRQLQQDHYRTDPKNSLHKCQQPPIIHQLFAVQNQPILSNKISSSKKGGLRDNCHLRNIIRQKLLEGTNKRQSGLPLMKDKTQTKPSKPHSKYQKLLSQFYGQPGQVGSKGRKAIKGDINGQKTTLQRHQSARSLRPSSRKQNTLQRTHSVTTIKQSTQISQKGTAKINPQKPTYLDIYMQKRKLILYL